MSFSFPILIWIPSVGVAVICQCIADGRAQSKRGFARLSDLPRSYPAERESWIASGRGSTRVRAPAKVSDSHGGKQMATRTAKWLAGVGLIAAASVCAAGIETDAAAWSRTMSNASNSDVPSQRLADVFLGGRIGVGSSGVIGRDWRWNAGLLTEGEVALLYPGLSQIEGGARAGIEYKFGLGWRAPKLAAQVVSGVRAAGQAGASGLRLAPSLALTWQFAERWGASGRYVPEWFYAEGALFDSASHLLAASGWFDVFPATRVQLTGGFRHGDVVSYAIPPRPDLLAISEVKESTDVFGGERIAYRLVADTYSIEIAVDQTVTEWLGLRAAYRWEITQKDDIDYGNHILELGIRSAF